VAGGGHVGGDGGEDGGGGVGGGEYDVQKKEGSKSSLSPLQQDARRFVPPICVSLICFRPRGKETPTLQHQNRQQFIHGVYPTFSLSIQLSLSLYPLSLSLSNSLSLSLTLSLSIQLPLSIRLSLSSLCIHPTHPCSLSLPNIFIYLRLS
jgi:hypothetical protein